MKGIFDNRDSDCALLVCALALLMCIPGCGGRGPSVRQPMDQRELTGVLSVDGETPFSRTMVFVDGAGVTWSLKAPGHRGEFYLLSGHTLKLYGSAGPGAQNWPLLTVSDYELVPGEGLVAIKGVISDLEDGTFITDGSGSHYRLSGPLSAVLSGFDGILAWVWGTSEHAEGQQEVFKAEGYAVLPGAR